MLFGKHTAGPLAFVPEARFFAAGPPLTEKGIKAILIGIVWIKERKT